jgi:hypothetical protein
MDLSRLTPEMEARLMAILNNPSQAGVVGTGVLGPLSPMRPRQLHDLRLLPTADDPRPTFFPSAEPPRDGSHLQTFEFPKLLFHSVTGTEICIHSKAEEAQMLASGYQKIALPRESDDPEAQAAREAEHLQAALLALPEHEREAILAEQKQRQRATFHERLSALPERVLEQVLAEAEARTGSPVKAKK